MTSDWFSLLTRYDFPGTTDPWVVLFMIAMAFGAGMAIGFVYMWTHEALSYSRTFVGALAVLPLIAAMLLVAMVGSLVVAFGLLGVFGVVRFRNVLKDTRDTCFVLWSIMEGMAIGTSRFSTAIMALLGIGGALLCFRLMSFGRRNRYDAVVNFLMTGDLIANRATVKATLSRHATRLDLASERRVSAEGTDVTYRVLLRDPSRSAELETDLSKTEGLQKVSVYMHDDEAEI